MKRRCPYKPGRRRAWWIVHHDPPLPWSERRLQLLQHVVRYPARRFSGSHKRKQYWEKDIERAIKEGYLEIGHKPPGDRYIGKRNYGRGFHKSLKVTAKGQEILDALKQPEPHTPIPYAKRRQAIAEFRAAQEK